MKKSYELVVFDWEGTLGDPMGRVLQLLSTSIERFNILPVDDALARKYVVLGLERALKKLYPDLTLHQYEQILQDVQQGLHFAPMEQCLFFFFCRLITQLHQAGVMLAIATNKGAQSLQRSLQHTELDDFFKVTRSASDVPPKPCPQMLEEIMGEFGVPASRTLMIGDSIADIEMAVNAQVEGVGVDFYYQQADDLLAAGASHVFTDYTQLGCYLGLSGYVDESSCYEDR